VETREARSCSLRTREVELEQLLGGKDPVLVKIDTDELISVRDRSCNPLDP
jgi:hypothetical protein